MQEYDQKQRAAICYEKHRSHMKGNCMQHLSIKTFSSYTPQRKMFEGRAHIVAPVILLTVGVHNGSAGPTFYSEEELRKFPAAWNGVPVPILHPIDGDGDPISCNSPEIIESQTVGRLFNTIYDEGKLRGEIWIDESKAGQLAPKVLGDILAGRQIEVSTGLFSDPDETSGEWNGETYNATARNIRPDHLALLPGQRGACSLEDGCGVRANKEGQVIDVKVDGIELKFLAYTKEGISQLLSNEASYGNIQREIQSMMDAMDVRNQDGSPKALHYVLDVFGDHFIYMKETPDGGQLFKQEYEVDGNDKINLKGNAEEVKRKVEYVPLNANNSTEKEDEVMKKCCPDKVKAFISADTNPYTEADKEMLESLSEEQFGRISAVNYQTEKVVEKIVEKEVKANTEAPKTIEELVANAPEDMKEIVSAGVKLHADKKEGIVKAILANEDNKFTKEELEAKSLGELEKLASLSRVPDYSGRGGADTIKDNAEGEVEILEVPTFVVNKEEKK